MATLNYTRRLANLAERKFDKESKQTNFSKSASASLLPENVKYLVESMRPIDTSYNQKTLEAANRVNKHLENNFKLDFSRQYRTQGSVQTKTNIKVHSDFDLLTVIDSYYYPEGPSTNKYTKSVPSSDIRELRKQATSIMKETYDEVNDQGEKGISIFNKALGRKVDIVFCFWYNTTKFAETANEYYRGVYLYNFPQDKKLLDYPFAAIQNINHKGDTTLDGSRRGIRLLKTLRSDSDLELTKLKSFQLTSVVHSIENTNLVFSPGREIHIANALSGEMGRLIDNPTYRKNVKCPKGYEKPFESDDIVPDLKSLKRDLDLLISDTFNELTKSEVVKRAVLNY